MKRNSQNTLHQKTQYETIYWMVSLTPNNIIDIFSIWNRIKLSSMDSSYTWDYSLHLVRYIPFKYLRFNKS